MSETPWKEMTLKSKICFVFGKIWLLIEKIWKILTGLPSALAVLQLIFFGIAINSFILKPIFTPRVTCTLESSEHEGDGLLSNFKFEVKKPLYLILPLTLSKKYTATLVALDGFTFYEAIPNEEPNSPKDFEKYFDRDISIAKVLRYNHKFTTKKSYWFHISISGKEPILEGECPFEFSVRY